MWATPPSIQVLLRWWRGVFWNRKANIIWNLIPLAIFWCVWKWRNDAFFNGKSPRWESSCDLVKSRAAEWARHNSKLAHLSVNDIVYNLRAAVGIG